MLSPSENKNYLTVMYTSLSFSLVLFFSFKGGRENHAKFTGVKCISVPRSEYVPSSPPPSPHTDLLENSNNNNKNDFNFTSPSCGFIGALRQSDQGKGKEVRRANLWVFSAARSESRHLLNSLGHYLE